LDSAADGQQIAEIFGSRVTKKTEGKLNTPGADRHGHHISAPIQTRFVKQYEKFSTFCAMRSVQQSGRFSIEEGLDHCAVREQFLRSGSLRHFPGTVPERPRQFPLLQRLALPSR